MVTLLQEGKAIGPRVRSDAYLANSVTEARCLTKCIVDGLNDVAEVEGASVAVCYRGLMASRLSVIRAASSFMISSC